MVGENFSERFSQASTPHQDIFQQVAEHAILLAEVKSGKHPACHEWVNTLQPSVSGYQNFSLTCSCSQNKIKKYKILVT